MAPKHLLRLEQLEERRVPATFNVPWPDPQGLTISFVPDGTTAGGQRSALFRTLDAVLPTRVWEGEILRAFQTWAAAADINVRVVPDGGQPFGTLGLKQGDPRFGDIRIGAFPLGSDALAAANPYDPFIANTSVGDIYLNSAVNFGIGGANGAYDLFSVLIHEAGHVFGLGGSSDPNSPMFEQYHVVSGLTPGDVAAIRGLYGARRPDAFEGPGGNPAPPTATPVSLTGGPAVIGADVATPHDADLFRVQVPAGSTALDVQLNASGSSLLVPRVTVFDGLGHVVASAVATDPLLNNLSLHIGSVEAGDTYYVKVESGTDDVFGVGAYQLTIDPLLSAAWGPGPGTPPYTPPPDNPLAGAVLLATTPGYVEHTYYEAVNSLNEAAPTRTYRVESPDLGSGLSNVMTVVVNSWGGGDPVQASVYDAQGNRVDAAVIADGNGHYAVQIRGVRSAADYFVRVTAGGADVSGLDARYEVAIDFALDATHLQTLVNDTLGPDTRAATRVLQVEESQQIQFVLSATDWGAAAATGVRMTITDAAGREVFSLAAPSGASRLGQVFLSAGRYTVQFTRDSRPGDALTPVLFELSGLSQSDNLGPQLRDTTRTPVDSSPAAAVPGPSFFFAPADPTNLLGGTPSHGSSGPGRVAAAGAAGVFGASPASTPTAARAAEFDGRPGGAGATLRPAPQPSAAGVAVPLAGAAGHPNSGPAGPTEAPAPGEALPVAAGPQRTAAPAEPQPPENLPGAGGSEAAVGSEAQLVVTDVVGAGERFTGPRIRAPQMWALGLGAAVLSTLALPARWCAALLPPRLRRGRPASAGPKRPRGARG